MSAVARTVSGMTKQHQTLTPNEVLVDPCLRCGSVSVRAIVYGPLDFEVEADAADPAPVFGIDDAPIFDCRDCGFEWGFSVRDLLA